MDGDLYYILGDHLGSTSLVVDESGVEKGYVIYDAYGRVVENTLPEGLTDRLYTGQVLDPTGLYYYNARYYDPFVGQFTQPDSVVGDPLDPRAWNRFSYVYGNPTNLVDPSGHCPNCDETPEDERLFQGPVDWISRISIVTAWPFFAASQGMRMAYHLGSSARIVGGISPEISYARRWIVSSTPQYFIASGTTEVYPNLKSVGVPTRFARWASTASNGLLAMGAVINTYDILDRYYRLGEITRQQAGYQLLTNAGFTGAYYVSGQVAGAIVAHYTAGATVGASFGTTALVGVAPTFLTFDLMVGLRYCKQYDRRSRFLGSSW